VLALTDYKVVSAISIEFTQDDWTGQDGNMCLDTLWISQPKETLQRC
jgi:hypothetical protein